ncbi:hypothetical protein ZYGR_0H02600 [Zygosaccharomyces rouxii]|uniref:Nucleolar complex-associated protein 3 n=2 Tax=Zygosaccharomyces rouxii TaxID=4956 RepID=C5DRN9_ZYGRC|nr:uncharacterized protein ZYRO0B09988g [Zygosaccharomyces rouxii]KAH9200015.1 CBF/Mak21 family-domain-containing protein [Zygosaccharomyces rouxii]GAV47418.1 hypothetical protein ZYGR_0H02600 [Zygosaccharomyces rouxii]CAR26450.1 ZYRO0B09988p [Zygosaccharomyces rouxii]
MGRRKRSQSEIKAGTAKKRKQEDALLEQGGFGSAGSDISNDDDMYEDAVSKPSDDDDSWDNLEQDYEKRSRNLKHQEDNMVEGLPIKINGKIERKMIRQQPKKNESKDTSDQSEQDEDASERESESKGEKEEEDEEDDENEQVPDTEEKIVQLKEEIADLVEKILEEPEENVPALSRLCRMVKSKNPNTCKFSMLALVPVFKSIIPGYRIRPLTELEKRERVSKEVGRLRHFEQSLVGIYKNYVDILKELSKVPNNDDPLKVQIGALATQAANELISNASHFNFRTEMFTLIIRRICKPNLRADSMSERSIKTLESLLNDDEDGIISLEIVRILCKTAKTRKYNVEESVINILLSLDVLSDYDPNTREENEQEKIRMKKKDRVHLSKKQRKSRKEMKQIEEEMRKAEQSVTVEERERNQAEILKQVFSLYLNILKVQNPKLVGAVLEGLVKFGSMANFELLGDFLEVMKELIKDADLNNISSSEVRKVLLCIVSSFSIVSNHSQMKFNVDLSSFVDALYALLPSISLDANIELSHKSMRLADPLGSEIFKPSVNVSTKAELLLKALDYIFFRSKSGTKQRAAAFTKRIYMSMDHTPEKTSIALLKFLDKLMNKYPEIGGLYSTEDRIGNGNFIMEADTPALCNPESATLWENSLLVNHYCPTVVKGIRFLGTRSKESQ